jgi:microcystin-dependent protein
VGNPNTGIFSPTANQIAVSLNGVQALLMAGTSIVTTLGVAVPALVNTGAYSGGTGQLVPVGAVLEWYDDVLPSEGGYCWANGQIIASANTVCPVLLARWGAKFGGNGTTTMGVPDRRNTVGVGKSTMGAVADRGLLSAATYGALLTTLGSLFGIATKTLLRSDLPNVAPTFFGTIISGLGISLAAPPLTSSGQTASAGAGAGNTGSAFSNRGTVDNFTPSGTIQDINGAVTQTTFGIVQPSTTCNFILRLA